MQVSVGIYAIIFIFFFLVIPGFIARRFYYHGEFSKTINWNSNILTNFLSSLCVGILLNLVFIALLKIIIHSAIDIDAFLNKFDSYFVSSTSVSAPDKFTGFTSNMYKLYLPFIGYVYTFSAIIGYFSSKLVIFLGLDTKWKLLRFSNSWHYLFSGKILRFKKSGVTAGTGLNNKVKHTYLDILVSEKGDETTLYSGLYADYELSFSDVNKLEKIHLYKAQRYKKLATSTETRDIPGHVFTIMAANILNINATYVHYDDNEMKDQEFYNKKMWLVPAQIIVVVCFFTVLVSFLFSINLLNTSWYQQLLNQKLISKVMIILALI